MIDNGEFVELSEEDLENISIIIHQPITIGREDAAKFLGVSLNKGEHSKVCSPFLCNDN